MKKKILYILSHPIQYQSPLLKNLAEQKEIDLKVFYLTAHTSVGIDKQFGEKIDWDTPLLDGYNYEFIKNYSPKPAVSGSFFGLMNFSIIRKIRKENPDIVIIHGWAYFTNWLIFILSFLFKAKLWLRAESPLNQELKKNPFVLFFKKLVLKIFLFKIIKKFLYLGSQNKEFYKYHGVKDEKLVFAPYSVDNSRFLQEYKRLAPEKLNLKKELNIPERHTVLLSVGKYITKKRPFDILEAFFLQKNENLTLVLLGEGNLRHRLEKKIKEQNIKNVHLTGFINQSVISKYYTIADVFILASTIGETWGLVVNEAMNFGLPVIVSDMPGSAYDLIEHEKNGFVYKTGNIEKLSKYINFAVTNSEFRKTAKTISLNKVKSFSYDIMVKNIINQIKTY